jgi:cobalamin biosynthesis protein CobD/CbiB|tara:strand:- start:14959 stop:15198 length:240 start_codon:yes stop_codon:yes gene_type:complete
MDAAYVLVIILSSFLALFLLLSIILAILLIRITLQIKAVTDTAQRTAGTVEQMVKGAKRFSGPAFLVKTIMKQVKKRKG